MKRVNLELIFILLLAFILTFIAFNPELSCFGDNARYMILGKSISQGSGFRLINYPENPPDYKAYPGFPLILSFFYFIFGSKFIEVNILILSKIIVFICFILSALFFYLAAKEELDKITLIFATIFFITHPQLLSFSSKVMTEIPFNLFILITMYFYNLNKNLNKDEDFNISFILLICFSIFTFLIRPVGIFIIFAIFLQIILNGKKVKSGIYLGITLIPVILWNLRSALSSKVSYVSEFFKVNLSDYSKGNINFIKFLERAKSNFFYYFKKVFLQLTNGLEDILKNNIFKIEKIKYSSLIKNLGIKDLHIIAILLAIIFFTLGVVYFIKKKKYIYVIYFILYFLGLMSWPWQSERLTICVIPILIILFSKGLIFFKEIILKISEKKSMKIFANAVLIIIFIIFLIGSTYSGYFVIKKSIDYKNSGIFIYSKRWENFYDAVYWLKENSHKGSYILSRSNFLVYILTNRETIAFPYSEDEQNQKEYLNKSDFIIQDRTNERFMKYVYPVIRKYEENFEIVYKAEDNKTIVYKRIKKLD